MSLKNSSDTIGNQTCDLPVCSTVTNAGSIVIFTSMQLTMYDSFLKINVRIYIHISGIILNFEYLSNNFYLCSIHHNIKFSKVPRCRSNKENWFSYFVYVLNELCIFFQCCIFLSFSILQNINRL